MLEDYGWVAWIGVALALAAVEAATVDLVFLMLAGGALGGAAAAAFGLAFPLQAIVAAVVACLLLLLVRPWAKRRLVNRVRGAAMGVAANVGRTAYVLETVTATSGRVKIGGETWSARSPDAGGFAPGSRSSSAPSTARPRS